MVDRDAIEMAWARGEDVDEIKAKMASGESGGGMKEQIRKSFMSVTHDLEFHAVEDGSSG